VVFCQHQPHDNGNWVEIPSSSEAPGLRTLALELTAGQLQWPLLSWDPAQLAAQLRALPDLEEVLLVRQLPRFIEHFLSHIHPSRSHPLRATHPVPKLSKHSCSFFYTQDTQIESWFNGSLYAGNMKGIIREKHILEEGELLNEIDQFVRALIWEDDAWLLETCGREFLKELLLVSGEDFLPNFKPEYSSSFMELFFQNSMDDVVRNENCQHSWDAPRFTVVYHQSEIVREICRHSKS